MPTKRKKHELAHQTDVVERQHELEYESMPFRCKQNWQNEEHEIRIQTEVVQRQNEAEYESHGFLTLRSDSEHNRLHMCTSYFRDSFTYVHIIFRMYSNQYWCNNTDGFMVWILLNEEHEILIQKEVVRHQNYRW